MTERRPLVCVAGRVSELALTDSLAAVVSNGSIVTWGATNVAATTVARWLAPGFYGAVGSTTAISFLSPAAGSFQNLTVSWRPAGNGNSVTFALWISGVLAASLSVSSTSSSGSLSTGLLPVSLFAPVELRVTKAVSIGSSPSDIIVTSRFV